MNRDQRNSEIRDTLWNKDVQQGKWIKRHGAWVQSIYSPWNRECEDTIQKMGGERVRPSKHAEGKGGRHD